VQAAHLFSSLFLKNGVMTQTGRLFQHQIAAQPEIFICSGSISLTRRKAAFDLINNTAASKTGAGQPELRSSCTLSMHIRLTQIASALRNYA